MVEERYEILIDECNIATIVGLNDTLIFIKGLFNEYYNDNHMVISVRRAREKVDEDEIWERNALM